LTAIIFSGPTLDEAGVRKILPGAEVRGPVACGDVYRAVRQRASAIAIIDGYFDQRLAVWHKEILWALAQGVPVLGAASMGALRAAELSDFGMVGVGRVFEWFRSGALEDDDEVAIVHEPAERGYRALSEAMVNIRATLERAVAEEVARAGTAATLVALAKAMFYPQRSYQALLAAAGVDDGERDALRRWLEPPAGHRVDQKQADALALLRAMRERPPVAPAVDFQFEHTEAWHELVRRLGGEPLPPPDPRLSLLWQEVQLQGAEHVERIWRAAAERALALRMASAGSAVDADAVQAASERFRRERDLLGPVETHRWLERQRLDVGGFSELMHEEATIAEVHGSLRAAILDQLPQALRVTGELGELVERAEQKAVFLAQEPGVVDRPAREVLLSRYFEGRLGRAVPGDVAAYARAAGFEDESRFLDAVAGELRFSARPR
jgi:hypothetical protein